MPDETVTSPAGAVGNTTDLRALFLLRPDVVFLNHGSFGACPRPVFEEYQRWQLELERQPVEFFIRRADALLAGARQVLGAYAGADPDDLVFVPNVTVGLNTVARSLNLGPGDEVLGNDHEYGALDRTWRFICARRGARYVRQPVALPLRSADEVVEAIWSGVTPRTRVLFVSHVTSPTAITFPVRELIRRARAEGILSVIDGAHAPGQIPLDLEALEPDVYSGNLHKWLCAPKGSGFLYVRRERQRLIEPLVVSWGWEAEKPGPSRFIDEQQWNGTRDIAAYLAVPAAIRFFAEHDWDAVRARCHELVRQARAEVAALTGLAPPVPDDLAWFMQMAALPLPPCDVEVLKTRLVDEHHIEIPVYRWNDRHFARISVQGYNSQADVEALVEALRVLLPEVATAS